MMQEIADWINIIRSIGALIGLAFFVFGSLQLIITHQEKGHESFIGGVLILIAFFLPWIIGNAII